MVPALIAPAVAMLAIGLHLSWVTWSSFARGRRSVHWPTALGTVVGDYLGDADGHLRVRSYAAGVVYLYEVDGQRYRNSVISYKYAFAFVSIRAALRAKKPYPKGASVTVHYDPMRPARAVLEPGIGDDNVAAVTLATIILIVGACMLLVALF